MEELAAVPIRRKEEREANRRQLLSELGAGEDLWVFAYGSLIWNPAFHYAEKRVGRLYGYHRAFCIRLIVGRGSDENPGYMLGLDRGGSCNGLLYRLDPADREQESEVIWSREMLVRVYHARWVQVATGSGPVKAIAFVVDQDAEHYAAKHRAEDIAAKMAIAEGELGSNSDYLFDLLNSLEEAGIHDRSVAHLGHLVRQAQARA